MMSRRRSRSPSRERRMRSERGASTKTDSADPRDLERRIFVGNLPTDSMVRKDLEDMFIKYGKINALSMHHGFGFVQFGRVADAKAAVQGENERMCRGYRLDVNMAAERRNSSKTARRQSPPRRDPYAFGDERDVRRERSPLRPARDERDARDPLYDRYRDARDPRDPTYRREEVYDRYYRYDDVLRRKEEPYMDRFREPWDSRAPREVDDPMRRERRREELYRKYYDEIQRRYDAERPVDCSVIVVNKQQKEYAESVGRKVRDLGMVVDLIFLNTEVSLTQALEDVSRGGTAFAIVITQQHEIHRSCTVNILFGTPQEHRNMPMADAMILVARNYERYKTETRDKEREEVARKAAKMADEVIMREREPTQGNLEERGNPPSIQPLLNLLADGRYLTIEEIDKIIEYLREKKERFIRGGDSLHGSVHNPAALPRPNMGSVGMNPLDAQPSLPSAPSLKGGPQDTQAAQQQELQAKILSLFNSGASGANTNTVGTQGPAYGSALNTQPQNRAGQLALSNSSYLSQAQQRMTGPNSQLPALMSQAVAPRATAIRSPLPQSQGLYGQQQPRGPTPNQSSALSQAQRSGVATDTQNTVWIAGHVIISQARDRAATKPYGINLGFDIRGFSVHWLSTPDLRWHELHDLIRHRLAQHQPPKYLLIHLGDNDIGYVQASNIIYMAKEVLGALKTLLPKTTLICSELLPRPHWAFQPGAQLENDRRTINGVIKKYMALKGQRFIEHSFDIKCQALYVGRGDYLTDVGVDLFTNSLMDSLKYYMREDLMLW
ncbi:nuclear receptor coactivator 5-like isoform X1 [Scyliorhinus canicula]|uniref:nuclear receptor coactivator 5-like isoform X1 n=1 Tax=Scyliorhinus canicula TaxID=7830 RepID=UPI0018F54382|nr:nuclear receptor coactivator 5-like isoform X1 [Scyliorhinus canicula]